MAAPLAPRLSLYFCRYPMPKSTCVFAKSTRMIGKRVPPEQPARKMQRIFFWLVLALTSASARGLALAGHGFALSGSGPMLPYASSRAARMCAGAKQRPLSLLKDMTGGRNAATRTSSPSGGNEDDESSPKYCKYDSIRELTRASRERSYAQGRDGCCSKAASYLETTASKPVDKGRWGRNA